ncbi:MULTISPECIES: citrate/2-methylcitrate synthase [Nitratiruptor]|uniref:ATP-citrate lyase alpha-subunit n=1 Tax=Nitratiruptor tergarcus DSM 16512 TaxID=1069081 RepID=A0A1W1WSQ6_9BACT|nr:MULTISPECIES: citrate/2-methylcitrate synthase [Nitratiruptor]BCD61895.1 ATP citrate (pro-S)-lyase [Nitratiruptor sp. YY08-13]BCD65830.1 ATP citrate (pro-S)-lyase [Nitratiruptor sp. YY08-26]SMC09324.1 ATP-citrate lyase alpha-subunit [Nitratiruptor tergarcus DSM 16512]
MGLFTRDTQAIFWNNNRSAIQRMLDYDYVIKREKPSVAAIVAPTSSNKFDKFFFGTDEVMIPIYRSTEEAAAAHPNADVLLNFASFRTAYDVTMDALRFPQFKTIMITAEGIPERLARIMNKTARDKGVLIIGPATVGAITPGAFKVANIGGTIENIVKSKLHRPGSCGLVTRSGGLFNELCNIIALNADGVADGVAIGGDRFVGSVFIDHLLRMEKDPNVKYMLLLGEVGGREEYKVIEAVKSGKITKPVIGWCIGTIAQHFSSGVQFGHAGASANADEETAVAKNQAMREAGIHVPDSFNDLPHVIKGVYEELKGKGIIKDIEEPEVPPIPEDYAKALAQGKIRKPKNFVCTISDDRGEEATYAGYPISSVATPDTGKTIGDVVSLLWFKKVYPRWAVDFIETVIKTVADHGPAVSGAHNAKVTARAGKSVVESLVTGLLTIGPRFGGAIDGAAKYFKYAHDNNMSPAEFLNYMKKQGIPIPGIGHRIKSVRNPDKRVEGLKKFAAENFPATPLLEYALEVEKLTTSKKDNLILNVDGTIGILMVDMWRALGYTEEEIDEFIESGTLNSFFILGRTIGFIGHILDEKRLGMPMYRHPFDDILYDVQKAEEIK